MGRYDEIWTRYGRDMGRYGEPYQRQFTQGVQHGAVVSAHPRLAGVLEHRGCAGWRGATPNVHLDRR